MKPHFRPEGEPRVAPDNRELPHAPDLNFGYRSALPSAPDPYLGAQPDKAPDWTGTYTPRLPNSPEPLTGTYTPELPNAPDVVTGTYAPQLPQAPDLDFVYQPGTSQAPTIREAAAPTPPDVRPDPLPAPQPSLPARVPSLDFPQARVDTYWGPGQ